MRWPARLVETSVRVLPAALRARYDEEWRHDLEAASELGLDQRAVALGAVNSAIRRRAGHEVSHTTGRGILIAVATGVVGVGVVLHLAGGLVDPVLFLSTVAIIVRTVRGREPRLLGVTAVIATIAEHCTWSLLGASVGEGMSEPRFSATAYLTNLASCSSDLRFLAFWDLAWWGPLTTPVVLGIVLLYITLVTTSLYWLTVTFAVVNAARLGRISAGHHGGWSAGR